MGKILNKIKRVLGGNSSVEVDTTNVISVDAVYETAGLTNKDKSIYKINDIKSKIPEMLPTDVRKDLTISMMEITNITVNEAITDAETRNNVLVGALDQFTSETENIKAESQNEIVKLQNQITGIEIQIDVEKQKIVDRSKIQEQSQDVVKSETKRIKKIQEFITA